MHIFNLSDIYFYSLEVLSDLLDLLLDLQQQKVGENYIQVD